MVLLHNLTIRPIPKIDLLFQIDHCECHDTHAGDHTILIDLDDGIAAATSEILWA